MACNDHVPGISQVLRNLKYIYFLRAYFLTMCGSLCMAISDLMVLMTI